MFLSPSGKETLFQSTIASITVYIMFCFLPNANLNPPKPDNYSITKVANLVKDNPPPKKKKKLESNLYPTPYISSSEKEAILKIPFIAITEDTPVWHFNRCGRSSVKSAYNFMAAKTTNMNTLLPHSVGIWKKDWHMQVPQKNPLHMENLQGYPPGSKWSN